MTDASLIVVIVNFIFLSIAWLIPMIYIIPIIFVRRFHTANNILTSNVCLVCIIGSIFWIIFDVILGFYPIVLNQKTVACGFLLYFQASINYLLVYSFTTVTINRALTIIYPTKRFFKRRVWAFISSVLHWVIIIILSIPNFVYAFQVKPKQE